MGILPIFYGKTLSIIHWSFLGCSGALTAAIREIRQSNLTEVGYTDGKRELWRATIGSMLGFVAGGLAYGLISGEALKHGGMVPDVSGVTLREVGLSIIWAFLGGYSFDRIFDRLHSTAQASTT